MSHHSLWTKLLCCVMLFALPGALMGADQAAMLYGTGEVTINTNPVQRTSAVFAGDKIQTGRDANVTIAFQGSRVNLSANSSIVYQPNRIVIDHGRALLQEKKGAAAQLAGLTITPAAGSAKFQLTDSRETVQVAALDGPLTVSDGTHAVLLPAGQQMSRETKSDADSSTGGATKGAPGSAVSGGLPGWAIGVIVAGAVGGTLGGLAAAGTFSSGRSVSPSKP
jgi:hypothetical protein